MKVVSGPIELGLGYTVTFTFDGQLHAEWAPGIPKNGSTGRRLLPAYREARDNFLTLVGIETGQSIAVFEV